MTFSAPANRVATINTARHELASICGTCFVDSFDDRQGRDRSEAGKLADPAILTADFLTVPEDQIMNIKSCMTTVDGRVVYDAQPAR